MKRYRNLQKDLFNSMKEPEDRIDMSYSEFKRALNWRWFLGLTLGAISLYVVEMGYVWYHFG